MLPPLTQLHLNPRHRKRRSRQLRASRRKQPDLRRARARSSRKNSRSRLFRWQFRSPAMSSGLPISVRHNSSSSSNCLLKPMLPIKCSLFLAKAIQMLPISSNRHPKRTRGLLKLIWRFRKKRLRRKNRQSSSQRNHPIPTCSSWRRTINKSGARMSTWNQMKFSD